MFSKEADLFGIKGPRRPAVSGLMRIYSPVIIAIQLKICTMYAEIGQVSPVFYVITQFTHRRGKRVFARV